MLDLLVMAALATQLQPGTIALDCRDLPCPLEVDLRYRVEVEVEVEIPAIIDELGTEVAPSTTKSMADFEYRQQRITVGGDGVEIELPDKTVIEARSSSHWIESFEWTGRSKVLRGSELAHVVFSLAEEATPITDLQHSALACDSRSLDRLSSLPMAWVEVSAGRATIPVPAGCANLVIRPNRSAPIPILNLEVPVGSTIDLEPVVPMSGGSVIFRLVDDTGRAMPDRGILLLAQNQVPSAALPEQQRSFSDESGQAIFVGISPGGWNPAPWDEDIPDQRAETLVIQNGELSVGRDRVFERAATLLIYPTEELPLERPMLIVHRKPLRNGEVVRVTSSGVQTWEQSMVQLGLDKDMLAERQTFEITPLLSGVYNIIIRDLSGGRVLVLAKELEIRPGEELPFYLELPKYHVSGRVTIGGRSAEAIVKITDRIKEHVLETDRSGRFEVDLLSEGRSIVTVENLELGISSVQKVEVVGPETEILIDFPIGTISGTVSPASLGLEAFVVAKKGKHVLRARVDSSGNFTIRGVAKGTWNVWAEVDGRKGKSVRAYLSKTTAAAGGLNLRLPDGGY